MDNGEHLGMTNHMASSDVTGKGYLTGPGLHDFPVDYAVVDGVAIHEGCIDMGPVVQVAAEAAEVAQRHQIRMTTAFAGRTEGAAEGRLEVGDVEHGIGLPGDSSFLWTNGRVAYSVDAGVPNQGRVDDAISHIEANTGIRFQRRTAANAAALPNWVDIISNGNEGWSSSAVGMRGGRQLLRLADGHSWPILVHEFLHALGVYHEQSRSDRDSFVDIKWDNIHDGPPPEGEINAVGNFQKKPDATDYFDYDYGSIMHYPRTSFAKDSSKPTIVPRQAGATIGQRNGMSFGDRQTVAKIYERFFTKGYAGVWRAGSGRYGLWANAEWDDFRAKWDEWSGQGLRIVDIHVHGAQNGLRYSGVFLPGTGGHGLWANATWDSFRAKWEEWNQQGLRLHDLHVHNVNGENRYSGVFLPGTGGHGLWANTTWESFVDKWQEWAREGLRLVDLNLHRAGRETRYSGVFLPGTDGHALWANVTWESFRAKWQELSGQGLRLVDFELVNPSAGSLFDSGDAGDEDRIWLEEHPEPFGGILEAAAPSTAAQGVPVDGDGALRPGEPAVAGDRNLEAVGGAHLPDLDLRTPGGDEAGLGGRLDGGGASSAPTPEPLGSGYADFG